MFNKVLSGIRDRVEGTIAVSLMALDGIAIATINDRKMPLELLAAEFGTFVRAIRMSSTELDTGEVQQFSLVTEKFVTFVSAVTSDYYILLVLEPDGNYGRARFELARAKHLLRDELI